MKLFGLTRLSAKLLALYLLIVGTTLVNTGLSLLVSLLSGTPVL